MKKHVIAYMVLHMINQHCPLIAAAAQPSIVDLLQQCDKQAFSIAQQIPQWGQYIGDVANLMQQGQETIFNVSRRTPTIVFNHPDQTLENDFKSLQYNVNTRLPRYLSQDLITTLDEQHQRLLEVEAVMQYSNMRQRYAKPNVPWFPLLTIYQQKLRSNLSSDNDACSIS